MSKSANLESPCKTDEPTEYECPYCDYSYSHELIVRAHIALNEDNNHSCRNGFMPEDEIKVASGDGLIVDTIRGKGTQGHVNLTISDLPNGLSVIEKHIVKTVVKSTHVDTYQELVDRINSSLRCEGLEPRSYTHIVNKIKRLFSVNSTEGISFEDLTDAQKRVLSEYAKNQSLTPTELAEKANVKSSYPTQVIEKYSHLIDDISERKEHEEKSQDNKLDSKNKLIKSAEKSQLLEDLNLTNTKKAIIECFAQNPNYKNKQVVDIVGCSVSYPSAVKNSHSDVIAARRKELGLEDNEKYKFENNDISETSNSSISWSELDEKERQIIALLVNRDDLSYAQIANEVTYDVSEIYVKYVVNKYGDINEEHIPPLSPLNEMRYSKSNSTESLTVEELNTLKVFIQNSKSIAESEESVIGKNTVPTGKIIMANKLENKINNIIQ